MANMHYDLNALTDRVGEKANPGGWMFGDNFEKWVAFVGAYCTASAVLVGFIPLKFVNGTLSTYETHGWFLITSIFGLAMTIFTSWIIFYTNNDLENAMKEHFSPLYNMILKSLFWFSAIISHFSLILVLIIPQKINWAGHALQFAIFLLIVAFHFKDKIKLIWERAHT